MTVAARALILGLLALSPLAGRCDPAADVAAPTAGAGSARCQVWARELSFAGSVAGHDADAFAAHLHANAVFGAGTRPTRGREAIVRDWQGIIDGSAVVLEWYPDLVLEGGDGSIVHSTGPALYRDPQTGEHRLGRFGSVWQRSPAGTWHVVFDDGTAPRPADQAAIAAFRAGRRVDCPDAPSFGPALPTQPPDRGAHAGAHRPEPGPSVEPSLQTQGVAARTGMS